MVTVSPFIYALQALQEVYPVEIDYSKTFFVEPKTTGDPCNTSWHRSIDPYIGDGLSHARYNDDIVTYFPTEIQDVESRSKVKQAKNDPICWDCSYEFTRKIAEQCADIVASTYMGIYTLRSRSSSPCTT